MTTPSIQRWRTPPWFLLRVPEVHPDALSRPSLYRQIEDVVSRYPLTILKAPSGFGKTTTLSLWAQSRKDPTAWFILLADHEQPSELLSGILAALINLVPDNLELRNVQSRLFNGESTVEDGVNAILEALCNEKPLTIVIDDAHFSSKDAMLQVAVPLAVHSGGKLRIVISGTHSVVSWMTKQVAAAQARILDSAILPFTKEEVVEVIDKSSSTTADTSAFSAELWEKTRGWPLAVQLFLLSSSQHDDVHELSSEAARITIATYLEDHVLDGLRDELKEFILLATVVSRFDLDLVTILTQNENAPALADECRRMGLFLEAFTHGDAVGYRWHSYFAEACQAILKRRSPEKFEEANKVASRWMREVYPGPSIFHAIRSGDPDFMLETIENVWILLVTSGQRSLLENYCFQLPNPHRTSPSILYILAACRDMVGDYAGGRILRTRADEALARLDGDQKQSAEETGLFVKLIVSTETQELVSAVNAANETLKEIDLSDRQGIHRAFLVGWTMMRLRHKPEHAVRLLSAVASAARNNGDYSLANRASSNLAFALSFAGQFTATRQVLSNMTPSNIGSSSSFSSFDHFDGGVDVMAAQIAAYWQGDMELAVKYGKELHSYGGTVSSNPALGRIYLACAASFINDSELWGESLKALTKVSDVEAHGVPWPAYKALSAAHIHWAMGDKSAAVNYLGTIKPGHGMNTTYVMVGSMWRRLGYPDEALKILSNIEPNNLVSYTATGSFFIRAAIAWERGEKDTAHELLERSLDFAELEGIAGPFINMDKHVRDLLVAHIGQHTKHRDFVLAQIARDDARTEGAVTLSSPLSSREQEILGYLDSTMSAQEIADSLVLSAATVRSHQQSIYRKLDVKNRKDAVKAARSLGLLRIS